MELESSGDLLAEIEYFPTHSQPRASPASCSRSPRFAEGVSEELQTSLEMNNKLQRDVVSITDKLGESQRKSKEVIMGLQKQIITAESEKVRVLPSV